MCEWVTDLFDISIFVVVHRNGQWWISKRHKCTRILTKSAFHDYVGDYASTRFIQILMPMVCMWKCMSLRWRYESCLSAIHMWDCSTLLSHSKYNSNRFPLVDVSINLRRLCRALSRSQFFVVFHRSKQVIRFWDNTAQMQAAKRRFVFMIVRPKSMSICVTSHSIFSNTLAIFSLQLFASQHCILLRDIL